MTLYLQMDGIDDYIKLPSMTLTRIVADVKIRRRTDVTRLLWDFRSGIGFSYIQQTTGGLDSWGSGSVKVDTVSKTNNTAAIPNDVRCIIEHTLSSGTDDGNIFSNNGAAANTNISGDIFNIKIYNGTTLQAHYDMTTGNVQDISGNGRHATLTGGTWVDDGLGGGTPTTQTGSASVIGVGVTSSSGRILKDSAVALNGYGVLSSNSLKINNGGLNLSGVGLLQSSGNMIQNNQVTLTGRGLLTANPFTIQTLDGSFTIKGNGVFSPTSSIIKYGSLSLSGSGLISSNAIRMGQRVIVDGTLKMNGKGFIRVNGMVFQVNHDLFNPIYLKGVQESEIYLKGKEEINIFLRGFI